MMGWSESGRWAAYAEQVVGLRKRWAQLGLVGDAPSQFYDGARVRGIQATGQFVNEVYDRSPLFIGKWEPF